MTSVQGQTYRYDLRFELGGEYDSNPSRIEQIKGLPTVESSPLLRLVGLGALTTRLGERWMLALSGGVGGKWFTEAALGGEDLFVVQSHDTLALRIGEKSNLMVGASYYDAYQRGSNETRDFRSFAPSVRFEGALGQTLRLGAGVGYRLFTFKPDHAQNFQSPTFMATFRHSFPGELFSGDADWEWSALVSGEWRDFQGRACTTLPCGSSAHRDLFGMGQLELTRIGTHLFGGGLAIHLNRSDMFGESLRRELIHFRTVVNLPLDITFSARAEAVLTHYRDKLIISTPISGVANASMEDESRSTLRLELSRSIKQQFEVGIRYIFYTSAPTSGDVDFQRQTILLYLAAIDES
jgi:hypothetical protein